MANSEKNNAEKFFNQNVKRIGYSKIEISPFVDFYIEEPDPIFGCYANRGFYIRRESEEEYWVLRNKSVLYDVPEKPIQIEGPDSVEFLERILARPISTLKEGRGRYAIACTHDGGVFMDGIVFKISDQKYWYVQADGEFETWLLAHSGDFDVDVFDPKSWVLQVQGPTSLEVMKAATNNAVNKNIGCFHSGFFDIGGQSLYISRTGWTGELGFEIYTQRDTNHKKLWFDLLDAGKAHGMVVGIDGSMNIRRVEAGILNNGSDMDMSITPFEAGLGPFIDFENETFIGRNALINAQREPSLYGVICNEATPTFNDEILQGEEIVAKVRTGTWSPELKSGIGYVQFLSPGQWVGENYILKTGNGNYPCRIKSLPFFDEDKLIPRGLI